MANIAAGTVRSLASIAWIGVASGGVAACVSPLPGSNVQLDLSAESPVQAPIGAIPGPNQLPTDVHFTLYAYDDGTDAAGDPVGRLFSLSQFEVHRVVDVGSPCFIDLADHTEFPGIHVTQYANAVMSKYGFTNVSNPPPDATMNQEIEVATAVQRELDVDALAGDMGIGVVTSASTATYGAVATDCSLSDPTQIPPPICTDDASNALRLKLCQAAWAADPDLFEGTDRVLTSPLAGTTHGFVDGINPLDAAPIGGAQLFVPDELSGFAGYAIYWQVDNMPDPGTLLLYGQATMPTLGVMHVHMISPGSGLTAELAIFANLDQDGTEF